MKIIKELEKKISEFIDSQEDELILEPDESMVIFSFSEEYEKLASKFSKSGLINTLANSFSKNEFYLGAPLDSKKTKHFLSLYHHLEDASDIYMSVARMSKASYTENEILNKIFVDLKKVDICKFGEYRILLKKQQ